MSEPFESIAQAAHTGHVPPLGRREATKSRCRVGAGYLEQLDLRDLMRFDAQAKIMFDDKPLAT
jgi:hypothetical protein